MSCEHVHVRVCVCVCVCSHLPALPVRAAMWRSDTVGTLSSVSWFSCSVFELHWIKDVFLFVCSCDHITFTVNRPWLPFKSVFSSFLSFLLEAPGLCLVSHHYCCSSVFPPVRSVSEEERSEHKKNQRLESFVGRIFFILFPVTFRAHRLLFRLIITVFIQYTHYSCWSRYTVYQHNWGIVSVYCTLYVKCQRDLTSHQVLLVNGSTFLCQ